jgi:predicted signal transduction protein with EAL and GGDEF domain
MVLSLGIAVMPADEAQQERLYERAAAAAYWTATFCDRNAATCENSAVMWDTFVKKAQFAGKLAYDVAQRYTSEQTSDVAPASYKASQPGTLRPDDMEPTWRGNTPRQGI